MVTFLRKFRRRALMLDPTDKQLNWYLECFAAGYRRGVADVEGCVPRREWLRLTREISARLSKDRSVMEAGCWLAGMYLGRDDAVGEEQDIPRRVEYRFCQSWESEYIGDCALECDPAAVRLRSVVAGLFWRRPAPLSIRVMQQRTVIN